MNQKLIVALDFASELNALHVIETLDPNHCALKVGHEMFTLFGPQFVRKLIDQQFKVFLDLKFHDIPNTVANACKAAADLGVWMVNVHAAGGYQMMLAAKNALQAYGPQKPLLIAVTVLTSLTADELKPIGIHGSLLHQVKNLAQLAKSAELDGVVSSAHEVKYIKESCGADFITVTPGIRWSLTANDDQSRVMTPHQAVKEGSDFLVIGRPITQAVNPAMVVSDILQSIAN